MMDRFILAIDQGTTGTTALLVDRDLEIRGRGYAEFRQHFPRPGWVEHDLDEVWASVGAAVTAALTAGEAAPESIAAVGITNQRETVGFWDAATGRAEGRAIVWQDRRTADLCDELRRAGHEPLIRERTGLLLDPYFSGTKIRRRLDTEPASAARAEAGELRIGTIDTWLTARLTAQAAFVTDVSNASRTLLFNLHTLDWDDALTTLLHVPRRALATIVPNAGVVGFTRDVGFLPDGIPIAGLAGDQQSALFGQACFAPGEAKCTYGTGAFVLMNTGESPRPSSHRLLTTVAWKLGGRTTYALEGSVFVAGAAVQWLRDGLGFFKSAAEIEDLAESVPDAGGVVVVPAFTGLGAPHWRPDATGLISGITRGTTRAHIARAVLDGIALSVDDLLGAMALDAGLPSGTLKVDGGAAADDLLMQIQADVSGVPVERPLNVETTAFGAAFLAGLGVGWWSGPDDIRAARRVDRLFSPGIEPAGRERMRSAWHKAVAKA